MLCQPWHSRVQGTSGLSIHMGAPPVSPHTVLPSLPSSRRGGGPRRKPQGWLQSWAGMSGTAISVPPLSLPLLTGDCAVHVCLLSGCLRSVGNPESLNAEPGPQPHPQAEKFQAKATSQPGGKLPAWLEMGRRCGRRAGPRALQHTCAWTPAPFPLGLASLPPREAFLWLSATRGRGAPLGCPSPPSCSGVSVLPPSQPPRPPSSPKLELSALSSKTAVLFLRYRFNSQLPGERHHVPFHNRGNGDLNKSSHFPGVTQLGSCGAPIPAPVNSRSSCPIAQPWLLVSPQAPGSPCLMRVAKLGACVAPSSRARNRHYSPSPPQGQARTGPSKRQLKGPGVVRRDVGGAEKLLGAPSAMLYRVLAPPSEGHSRSR